MKNIDFFTGKMSRLGFLLTFISTPLLSVLPALLLEKNGEDVNGLYTFLIIISFFIVIIPAAVKRMHDIGKSSYYSLFLIFPGINILFLIYLITTPGKINGIKDI